MPGYTNETQYPKGIATQIGVGTLTVGGLGSPVKVNSVLISVVTTKGFFVLRPPTGPWYAALQLPPDTSFEIQSGAEYPDGLVIDVPTNGNATVFYFQA